MKVLFKNTTKYNKDTHSDFVEFHSNKYGKKELIKYVVMMFFALYILMFNLIHKNWIVILVVLILGLIIYFWNKQYLKEKKRANKNKLKEYTFYFYENHMKIKCGSKKERLKYFEFHKVFETDKYFFLYLDEKNSLILSKDGFIIGTSKEFAKFIKSKCIFRYSKEK